MSTVTAFAEVVLPLPLEKSFHYAVPDALAGSIAPGVRVEVPFGKKLMTGYVVGLTGAADVANVRDIAAAIDPAPVITAELFSLARWLSGRYLCSTGEALSTIAPCSLRPPKRRTAATTAAAGAAPAAKPALTAAQKAVAGRIAESLRARRPDAFLLHGVTSSGKTEVYLSCIEEALSLGRSAIFLLPEISLTPQFIAIVQKRFPGLVGVWHSKLSAGQRFRTWDAARSGAIRVMLGARSAVFAPFADTGLIVVDEEHEPTYKQEQRPAYQTRDVAIERARLNNAAVILGSATPSLEAYSRALNRELVLLELSERIDGRALPAVSVIDAGRLRGRSKILSGRMLDALARVLARREQAILFLNRRGFSPGIMCPTCGEVWQCPRCSVSLVYHRQPEGLRCHYCDYARPWPAACPKCGERQLSVFGVGTQKVEEELKRLLPQGRVFRLDRDSASRRGVYEKAYDDFRQENVDILLGTQMVAKGFDFPRVTLVGVIDADTALYLPDFRSAERTFQLITQVAGRCGRGNLGGEVIVQTRHPDHYALLAAQRHDYATFYRQEVEFRRQMNYPPFCRLANVLVRGKKEDAVRAAAEAVGKELDAWRKNDAAAAAMDILGPAPASHTKLHGLFRWQVLLKGELPVLLDALKRVRSCPLPPGVLLGVDVDPQNTL